MNRIFACGLAAATLTFAAPALAASAPTSTATPATGAKPLYTSTETPLGDLLDNPATKAILVKQIPDVVNKDQIDMARGMSLKALQGYAGDQLTDAKLAAIDAELAKLPHK